LPDGKIVVCDMSNWDLVAYDRNFNQIKRLKGTGAPKPSTTFF